ncbi:MAG: isocitrate lyase/phosphoenolpyruvate mutase family protein, partial [Candidatus Zixiibacteriota bacterium]
MPQSEPDQRKKAEDFLGLHHASRPFVLGNAWDVASARIFELAGFRAIGTTSAGIAATLGFPDGQHITVQDTAEVVRRMVKRVAVPVSADIEAGYASSVEGVVESARVVLQAGAVGINIEDSTSDPENPLIDPMFRSETISAIRRMAADDDIRLVINARTDTF